MYERFTERARKVMQLANQEAQWFNHEYLDTEHILLGIVKEDSSVAANVLKNLDVDLRKIRVEVEKFLQPSPEIGTPGKLPLTPKVKQVIEYAIEESKNFNHDYVGTEHLTLGLIRVEGGIARAVLQSLGVSLERLRVEIVNILNPKFPEGSPSRTTSFPVIMNMITILRHIKMVQEVAEGVVGPALTDNDGMGLTPLAELEYKECSLLFQQILIRLERAAHYQTLK